MFRSASRERAKDIDVENANLETELNSILRGGNQTDGDQGKPGGTGSISLYIFI